jgi:hypothetical protein
VVIKKKKKKKSPFVWLQKKKKSQKKKKFSVWKKQNPPWSENEKNCAALKQNESHQNLPHKTRPGAYSHQFGFV